MDWLHLLLQSCSVRRIHWFEPKEVRARKKIRRDPSLSDSNNALTPLSDGGQLWLVTRGEEHCFATSGLLRTRAKARTQTLKE